MGTAETTDEMRPFALAAGLWIGTTLFFWFSANDLSKGVWYGFWLGTGTILYFLLDKYLSRKK
jgi:multidrug transporter EmrE-like cation transporter